MYQKEANILNVSSTVYWNVCNLSVSRKLNDFTFDNLYLKKNISTYISNAIYF
jgi:hypothetical protein